MAGYYNLLGWRVLRERQLALHPTCAFCAAAGRISPATVADHITPHRGDRARFFDPTNLQSLCKTCHDSIKQAYEKSGHLKGSGLDGLPLDGAHPWFQVGEAVQ